MPVSIAMCPSGVLDDVAVDGKLVPLRLAQEPEPGLRPDGRLVAHEPAGLDHVHAHVADVRPYLTGSSVRNPDAWSSVHWYGSPSPQPPLKVSSCSGM